MNLLADPESICRRIALNQYGPAAGETAFRAWQEIECAQRMLSNCTVWCPGQWPNWYPFKGSAPLPEFLAGQSAGLDAGRLVPKAALGFTYNDGAPGGPFKDFEIGYPQFYQFGGRNFVAYANKTSQLRINEVPEVLLDDAALPG